MTGLHLTAIAPPRLNERPPTAVEALLQALALGRRQRFALELAGEPGRVRFLVRSETAAMHEHLLGQVRLAYPQAAFVEVAAGEDPARAGSGAAATSELRLRAPPYLPLRDYADRDWQAAGADPVLGLLAALADCGPGERAVCQLVLTPAAPDWSKSLQRLALEHPLGAERQVQTERSRAQARAGAGPGGGAILLLLALVAGGLQARAWLAQGSLLPFIVAGLGLLALVPLLFLLARVVAGAKVLYDPRLVAEKVSRAGYHAHPRLVAWAATPEAAQRRLRRLEAAYLQFSLATGNGLVPARWTGDPTVIKPGRRAPWHPLPLLTVREVATLWHLPRGEDEVPFLERATSRRWLPAAAAAADGCPVGVAEHQAQATQAVLTPFALARHSFLLAKTGRGKSTLMQRLAVAEAARGEACVVVVDPHGDLAREILAALPGAGVRDAVYVDFADRRRPVGVNLLDAHVGRDRDKTVSNILDCFAAVWVKHWGPRMEDALRYALLTLFEVNQQLPPDRQYSVLAVNDLYTDVDFRRRLLGFVRDHDVRHWWTQDFGRMSEGFAQQVTKPVQTKLNRFAGSLHARDILGQPRTTLDLRAILRERRLLLVNTAAAELGDETAGLLGTTLVNHFAQTVMEQGALPPDQRVPARVFLDEFQTMPAVRYARLLGQLRKFGASFTLATQALATMDVVDPALRPTVFANVDTLAVFQVSAEDARSMADELDRQVDVVDLVNLPDHHCYLKTSEGPERRPLRLVRTLPPLPGDPAAAEALAWASAARFGRASAEVARLRAVIGAQHHAWKPIERVRNRRSKEDRAQQAALPDNGEAAADEDVDLDAEGEPVDDRSAREMNR